jgi:two-component system KDP operon response regulator KdpE
MTANIIRILIIEDEQPIRRFLRASLGSEYDLAETGTGKEGLQEVTSRPPDLILLDLGLPDMDGLEIIKQVRQWSTVPIIVLSARGQEKDKVTALDFGADDYLTKPFGVGELLARMRVALRHAARTGNEPQDTVFKVGDLKVDLSARRVFLANNELHLTPIEYKLLTILVQHAGKVLTHTFLLKEVWGPGYAHDVQYLRVFMAGLRRKIEANPAQPRYILTEQGVGYRLEAGEMQE